ncbi:recombinase family protein [Streptomyces sp. NPDC059759]|uniref:recombinase family protein n=1 Tax=Streptomyces sp. NPDC059759 TaxID=3346936 RepID=UPI0036471BFA
MRHEPADPQLAAIYCRMSEDREGGGLGVDRQREDCEQLAQQLGLTVVRVYTDNDLSAYSGKPRPGYQQMLEDLRAGAYGTVIAWHTDRLHRSPRELEEYIDVCEPRSVQTRTVKAGALDLTTATGRMIARQLGVQARYEVERMVERQRRARDQKVQRGEWSGGPRPYGWEKNGTTPIPEEIEVIREAAEAVLAGGSIRALAADLNARGLLTSQGVRWDGGTLSRMLRRPRNAGIIQHRGEEAGPAEWEGAIDEPTWRSLRAILDDPSRIPTASNVRKYLGSGLYLCGVCGEGLTSHSKGAGLPSQYKCRKNACVVRGLELLDKWVVWSLLVRMEESDAVDVFARPETGGPDLKAAQAALTKAREQLDQLAAAFGAGEIDMQEWRIAREGAKAKKAAAEAVLSTAVRVNPMAELLAAEDKSAAWSMWDLARQRAAIDWAMTVRVLPSKGGRRKGGGYWDSDAVAIDWKK